jgi:hypothetical protein
MHLLMNPMAGRGSRSDRDSTLAFGRRRLSSWLRVRLDPACRGMEMNRMAVLYVSLLAAALACASLALASLSFTSLLAWGRSLSPVEAKLVQPGLLVFSALLAGLAFYVRRPRRP